MTTERWAFVPVEPIDRPAFCDRGESRQCCWDNSGVKCCSADIEQAKRDAEPGAALLAEVLAARDALAERPGWNRRLDRLLAALDKLGPTAEDAT